MSDLIDASGLPKRHLGQQELTGDGWAKSRDQLLNAMLAGSTAILSGDRGRGKTQMATSVARAFAERHKGALYVRAMDLFRDLREAMRDNRESACVRGYVRRPLLIIDDAHERGDTDYETRSMVNLVDHRYGDIKGTILITNQSPAEFAKSVGRSIVSRIQESGLVIECGWGSYRGKS